MIHYAMLVRRITPDQSTLHRHVRLTALQDTPSAFGTTYADAAARPDEKWQQMTASCSEGTESAIFFAYDDTDTVVGMVGGFRDATDRDRIHLVSMWVAPEARGTGAASSLVEAVFAWAKSVPVNRVVAAVTPGNKRALRFYTRMGFAEPIGACPFVPHADADDIVWVRQL